MFTCIDHLMICVPDLEQGAAQYRRLGFNVQPGGTHPGKGTHNAIAFNNEDELFFILKGRLRIEMEQSSVELREGEMFVVPKGVRHNPVAEQECHVLLIERKSTLHTGDVVTAKTRSIAEQLRPV